MSKWQQQRQIILALTIIGVFFTLARFSLDSTAGKRSVAPFVFPKAVPLPEWQVVESRSLVDPIANPPKTLDSVLASWKYLYRRNDYRMEIEMRYIVGTSGEIGQYFNDHTSLKWKDGGQLLQNLRQQEGIGFYSLFVYQGRSHLSACINPRGGSTVTSTQFIANHHTYGLQLQRLVPWLLGKESFQDKRCLWTHLSTPFNQDVETTYPVLEQAWLSWYQWWHPRFPPH